MDELELLIAILGLLFKLVAFVLKMTFRLLSLPFKIIRRAQSGGEIARREPARALRTGAAQPVRAVPPPPQAPARPARAPAPRAASEAVDRRLAEVGDRADARADQCEREPPNAALVDTLRAIARRAEAARRGLRGPADPAQLAVAGALADELSALLEIVDLLARQRREPELYELLSASDALAAACYRPIVEFCSARRIPLSSDRTATVLDGDKLYFLRVDDPSGLAVIVLPGAWATDLGWWPAIAHEIGHDFYGSVPGLDRELRRRLAVPAPASCKLPRGGRLTTADLDAAVGAWQEELFADAFGTMMLGPAYVATMSWIFQRPQKPEEASAALPDGPRFEEHPPGHVRVACACRLLADMGYGAEADRLLAAWRARHREPDRIYFPSASGSWLMAAGESVIARAYEVASTLYRVGLDALLGVPLRSIPGLDLGPREHEQARRVREALLEGRRLLASDPRLVISGAALAWLDDPKRAPLIFRSARQVIDRLAPRRAEAPATPDAPPAALDPALIRDAIVLDAILNGNRARRGPSSA